MLTGGVVDEVLEQLEPSDDCKILPTELFHQYAMNGDDSALKKMVQGDRKVAMVLNLPEQLHYVAVSLENEQLSIRDSLSTVKPNHDGYVVLDREIQSYIGRLIHLLRSNGRRVKNEILLVACPKQQPGSNDCGVESIINTIMTAKGIKDRDEVAFCRTELQRAHHLLKCSKNSAVKFTFVRDATSKKCGHRGCNRQLRVSEGWCPIHHPVLRDSRDEKAYCTAGTSRGRGLCSHLSMNFGGVNTCEQHTDLSKVQKDIQEVLAPYSPERAPRPEQQQPHQQQPKPAAPAPTTAQDKRRARSHKDVISFMQLLQTKASAGDDGGTFEIQYELTDQAKKITKRRLLVQLKSQLKWTKIDDKRVRVAQTVIRARFCEHCSSWHRTPEDDEGNPIDLEGTKLVLPDPSAKYYSFFQAPLPSDNEEQLTPECGDEDDDLGSDYDHKEDGDPVHDLEEDLDREGTKVDSKIHPVEAFTVKRCRGWNVYDNKPDKGIHNLVWNALSSSTRRNHINILKEMQQMPEEWDDTPLANGVVDMVLDRARKRGWKWSTIASYLSSCGSACRDLHLYSDQHEPVDLKKFRYFNTALVKACSLAKSRGLEPVKSKAFTLEEYERLEKSLSQGSDAWYLLIITWYFAGRIGDMRRLLPRLISIDLDHVDEHGYVNVKAQFVEGKGAYFWGPYTINTSMPRDRAQQLQEFLRERPQDEHAFSQANQRTVSKAISTQFPLDHSVRSLRRGRLVSLAKLGVPDEKLKLLSGHRRMSTLQRYLGFGHHSSDGLAAAKEVARADHAAQVTGGAATDTKGMWASRHSGLRAPKGRRTQEPPQLFSMTAPSREECGLDPIQPRGNREDWRAHVPNFEKCVQSEKICSQVKAKDLKKAMKQAEEYRTTSKHYGKMGPPLTADQLPYTKFPPFAVRQMLEGNLLLPLPPGMNILSACNGFLKDEEQRKRWRIITETLFNRTMDKDNLPPLGYPSGREVVANIAGKKYAIQFDFKGYYFQIELGDNKYCYVVKTKEPVMWNGVMTNLFVLNKMPMGGAHSAHVAQTTTWCICEPLMEMEVFLATMIDNVMIASDNADEFFKAVQTFLRRCDEFSATLNFREKYDANNRESILKLGEDYARGDDPEDPTIFLGVQYQGDTVCNTERNVKKLREAYERLQAATKDSSIIVTRRHLASIISLSAWLAYVLQVPLCNHSRVLKLFSAIESKSGSWDEKIEITSSTLNILHPLVNVLIDNKPVTPWSPKLPSINARDYDITIIVDAYHKGWGGYVWVNGKLFRVKAGWDADIKHSAWAEPIAASKILKWARAKYHEQHDRSKRPSIALVTDHEAMPGRQRRPISARGGFSPAYFLNRFYQDLYGPDGQDEGQVFHVEGVKNIADKVSREPNIGDPLTYVEINDRSLPSLDQFHHPFLEPKQRAWWNR